MSRAPRLEASLRYAPFGFQTHERNRSKTVTNHLAQLFTIMLLTEDAGPYKIVQRFGSHPPDKCPFCVMRNAIYIKGDGGGGFLWKLQAKEVLTFFGKCGIILWGVIAQKKRKHRQKRG